MTVGVLVFDAAVAEVHCQIMSALSESSLDFLPMCVYEFALQSASDFSESQSGL